MAIAVVTCLLSSVTTACTATASATFAPLDQPGPPLTPSAEQLAASIECSPIVGHSGKEPVLLVPGTTATFDSQFKWNFATALSNLGIPWCGVSPPPRQLGDAQVEGEYDVNAIRYLYHRSGYRKIAIVGHSQGGIQPRWALRFWPDVRAMVADQVGIAPDNQGATNLRTACAAAGTAHTCPLNFWQGATGSNFIQALNSRAQMFPGIDYTVIYSTTDEIVLPQDTPLSGTGSYRRIALQDICPGHVADHVIDGTVDPISWAITLDAITHPGPADPTRIPRSVCSQLLMPGVTATNWEAPEAAFAAGIAAIATGPKSSTEPPLACYTTATCTGADAPTLTIWKITKPRGLHANRRAVIRILVRTDEGGVLVPAPGVTLTLAGHRRITDDDGDTSITANFTRPGRYRITATRAGTNPATTTITVKH